MEGKRGQSLTEQEVERFWSGQPCGANLVGGVGEMDETFFDSYDMYRYEKEPHILKILDNLHLSGLNVLEIGLGTGADSEQIIRRGAQWWGIDLTQHSVELVNTRFHLRKLESNQAVQGSVLEMPFEDNTFDVVYSFGVLHHVPDIDKAQAEIARVLKPAGRLAIMVYARWSINYLLSISILRRVGLLTMILSGVKGNGIVADHIHAAKREGIYQYLRMSRFIHANTDGPRNPYSKVYTQKQVQNDFYSFEILSCRKYFPHAPPLPTGKFPGSNLWGWHLIVSMTTKS